MLAPLVVALLVLPAVGWADRRFLVGSGGDPCSTVCEFRLCLKQGAKPSLRPCVNLAPVEPDIVIRTMGNPVLRLRLRGATAQLYCIGLGAPCNLWDNCESNDECDVGVECHPFMRVCARATMCPGDGYYPGAMLDTDEKFTVVAYSDACSHLCEYRLCLVDDVLVPCAGDVAPDVTVRAPFVRAEGRFGGREPPFVLRYGRRQHVTLKCQLVGAPCRSCDTPEDCFTGGACVDGGCRTTALCQ